jgi:hypothetical protein
MDVANKQPLPSINHNLQQSATEPASLPTCLQGDAPTSPPTPSSGSSSSAIAAEQAPASSSSGSEGASSSTPGVSGAVVLGKLQAAEPIDRLRYQAQLLFDALDTDYDGGWRTGLLRLGGAGCRDSSSSSNRTYAPVTVIRKGKGAGAAAV